MKTSFGFVDYLSYCPLNNDIEAHISNKYDQLCVSILLFSFLGNHKKHLKEKGNIMHSKC